MGWASPESNQFATKAEISYRRGDGKLTGVMISQVNELSRLSDEVDDEVEEIWLTADQLDTIMSEIIKNSPI